jgi:hypothetical protein
MSTLDDATLLAILRMSAADPAVLEVSYVIRQFMYF